MDFKLFDHFSYYKFRMGGLVLDAVVNIYKGFVVFQPIINGIGGNLVSVQASKISTMLHQSSIIGIVPPHTTICESPWRALIKGGLCHLTTNRKINELCFNVINKTEYAPFQFHLQDRQKF